MTTGAAHEVVRVRLRLVAWGATDADVDTAIRQAGLGSWRADWEFVEVERSVGGPCPVDPLDGGLVASGAGDGWAYAVYPARATPAPSPQRPVL